MKRNIYGISSKFNFGKWDYILYKFSDEKIAQEWLNREEYDFRERELITKANAIRLVGKKAVDKAFCWEA